jgi:hypothetical protein
VELTLDATAVPPHGERLPRGKANLPATLTPPSSASLSSKDYRKCRQFCETVPLASIDNPSVQNARHQSILQVVVPAPTLPQSDVLPEEDQASR